MAFYANLPCLTFFVTYHLLYWELFLTPYLTKYLCNFPHQILCNLLPFFPFPYSMPPGKSFSLLTQVLPCLLPSLTKLSKCSFIRHGQIQHSPLPAAQAQPSPLGCYTVHYIVLELTWPCIRNKQGMQLHECDWLACLTQSSKLSFSSCHLFPISGHIASKITCQKKTSVDWQKNVMAIAYCTAWTARSGYEWKKRLYKLILQRLQILRNGRIQELQSV